MSFPITTPVLGRGVGGHGMRVALLHPTIAIANANPIKTHNCHKDAVRFIDIFPSPSFY